MAPLRSAALAASLLLATATTSTRALDQKLYGINYDLRQGPDWDPKKCKPATAIAADLKILKTISDNVRTYSLSDCDVAPVLVEAKKLGMTVWIGVWVSADKKVYAAEVAALKALLAANLIDKNVVGFNVGSEAVYRKDITPEQAIEYLKDFKSVLAESKITAPVSITDIVDVLTAYPDMVAAGDVVTANQFPFWEKIDPSKAVAQFDTRIKPLVTLAAGKEVIISETGWPTGGKNVNASETSPEGAARYLNDFYILAKERGWKYYYFAGFDTPYKAEQAQDPETVEEYFGIFGADGVMKTAYSKLKFAKSASANTTAETGADSKDSTSPGTVHAGNTNSTGKSTSKSNSSSSSTANKNGANSNSSSNSTDPANASSRVAVASLTACLAIVSAVLLSV